MNIAGFLRVLCLLAIPEVLRSRKKRLAGRFFYFRPMVFIQGSRALVCLPFSQVLSGQPRDAANLPANTIWGRLGLRKVLSETLQVLTLELAADSQSFAKHLARCHGGVVACWHTTTLEA